MTDLAAFAELVPGDHGLVTVASLRADGSVQASTVNAGVLPHPVTGAAVVALVAAGGTQKLRNLRRDPRITVTIRTGWQWATVEGIAELVGPDDALPDLDADAVRRLLRDVFTAAGGSHEDWDEYDRVMAAERRTAVLVTPGRVYSNPT